MLLSVAEKIPVERKADIYMIDFKDRMIGAWLGTSRNCQLTARLPINLTCMSLSRAIARTQSWA
jgi:hypothetical protein